jgi:hypothetical protein
MAEGEGAPSLSWRGAWEGERKVLPCCSAAAPALCCADAGSASGTSRPAWP